MNESEIDIVDLTIIAGSLSELEQTKLQQLETVINRGKQHFSSETSPMSYAKVTS